MSDISRDSQRSVVDFHVHAFPDAVAPRALEALLTTYGRDAVTDATVRGTLEHMSTSGVSVSVLQPVATKPSQVESINNWAASQNEPGVVAFGGIHPLYENIASEMDRIVSLGMPGIKIQGNWQDVFVDDRAMYPIYDAAQGRLIVMFHAGEELTPFEVQRATPRRLARVRADFPRLTMITAHMGGYLMWDDVEDHLLGRDVYFDTSACFSDVLPDGRLLSLIRRHGPEKVLFATDLPFGDPNVDVPRLERIGLSDAELELIFFDNARRLLPGRIAA